MTDGMTDIPKLSDLLIGILQLVLSCDGHLTHLLPLSLQVLKLLLQHDTIVSSFMLHQQFSRPSHSILVGLPRSKLLLKSLHSSALIKVINYYYQLYLHYQYYLQYLHYQRIYIYMHVYNYDEDSHHNMCTCTQEYVLNCNSSRCMYPSQLTLCFASCVATASGSPVMGSVFSSC